MAVDSHQDPFVAALQTLTTTTLGHSYAGGFTRAFRRWTGMSPRQYRAIIRRAAKVDPEGFRGA